jgi:RHS repeat-associated protein
MVINDANHINEAIMYQPYGTMVPVRTIANPEALVRDKFTTKEFDEEGADMGRLDFEMTFAFPVADLDLDATKYNAVGIYYTDYPAVDDGDIVLLKIDEASNTAVAKATFNYSAGKQIKWVHILLNSVGTPPVPEVNCLVDGINENVGPGSLVTIRKSVTLKSELATVVNPFFTVARNDAYHFAGIGQYYFGARYYDPEVGVWGAVDPVGQFWNPYGYGMSPVMSVDPDGTVLFDIAFVNYICFNTDIGYDAQEFVSPVAFKWDEKRTSEYSGSGYSASYGLPKIFALIGISGRKHGGETHYRRHYDNSYIGIETREGSSRTEVKYFWGATPYFITHSGTTYYLSLIHI